MLSNSAVMKTKNILYITCAQIITLADPYIFSLFRTSMKRTPSLLFLFAGDILPAILLGTFLALSIWHESKRDVRTVTGLSLVLMNTLLLVFHFKGYLSFSSYSPFPLHSCSGCAAAFFFASICTSPFGIVAWNFWYAKPSFAQTRLLFSGQIPAARIS